MPYAIADWSPSDETRPKKDPAIESFDEILKRESACYSRISSVQLVLIANHDCSAVKANLPGAAPQSPYQVVLLRTLHQNGRWKQTSQLTYVVEIVSVRKVEQVRTCTCVTGD